jgi:predicted RNA-binding Zn-ribbon protein involved in translation (DUF1610 family)
MNESDEKLVELQPEKVVFTCPDCGAICLLWPRATPMAVQHALPTCVGWKKVGTKTQIEKGEAEELTADFLRRANLPVLGGLPFA